jgi:hypothetical protein
VTHYGPNLAVNFAWGQLGSSGTSAEASAGASPVVSSACDGSLVGEHRIRPSGGRVPRKAQPGRAKGQQMALSHQQSRASALLVLKF